MSDTVQIVTVFFSFLGTVLTAVMAYLMAKLNRKADDAAVKVDNVATKLSNTTATTSTKLEEVAVTIKDSSTETNTKLDELIDVGEKTHTLVNSAMGAQLRLHAQTARAKANITKNQGDEQAVADEEAAQLAERVLQEHELKQVVVDINAAKAAKAANA